jgi:hypothetical protein
MPRLGTKGQPAWVFSLVPIGLRGDRIGTDGSRRALGRVDVAVSGGEQDLCIILCAVEDVDDDHRVGVDTVEDQVPAVAAPADP